jgi:hypothetical protein
VALDLAATALFLAGLLAPLEAGALVRSPTNPVPLPFAGDEDACQFAIMADNSIGEDVWILFSESEMWPKAAFRNIDYFETMSDRRLSPGEMLNVRYEVGGRCGATRNWRMVVRIGPRGGEKIQIRRRTNDPSDRTIHLGEPACWAMAGTAPEALDADRVVEDDDEAMGCDPETTQYGLVPAEDTDDPVADRPAEEVDVDQFQGNWIRVESNNPRNNGMRIRIEGERATITAMPPRGSSRLRVGQVIWDDVSYDGSLGVRGSDGAFYPSRLTMDGSNRMQLDIDLENSPGNDQTWERAGPSIDGDWVLTRDRKEGNEGDVGLRIRVEGDRATIRYVPVTAGREFRVGDLLWRNIDSGDRSDLDSREGRLEALSGGGSYEPALYVRRTKRDGGALNIFKETASETWYKPEYAEARMADADNEDEDDMEAAQGQNNGHQLEFGLAEAAVSLMSRGEATLHELFDRPDMTYIDVEGDGPGRLILFAAGIEAGRVTSLSWSAPFQTIAGADRPSLASVLVGDETYPDVQFSAGDQFVPGEHLVPSSDFLPRERVTVQRYESLQIVDPRPAQVPEAIRRFLEGGLEDPGPAFPLDRPDEATAVYVAVVPADASIAAASLSRPAIFIMHRTP